MSEYRVKVSVRNNLLLSAIEATGCRSVSQFCEQNGLNGQSVNNLISLRMRPILPSGEFTPLASSLMEILGACPSDLWTKEQLELRLKSNSVVKNVDAASLQATLGCNAGITESLPSPEEAYEQKDMIATVRGAMDALPKRLREVIRMRFDCNMTLAEIGEQLGVSKDRARQLEQKGIHLLRHPRNTSRLRDYAL